MTARTLSRRLARLEARSPQPNESVPHTIVFIDSDGTEWGALVLGPGGTRTWTESAATTLNEQSLQ